MLDEVEELAGVLVAAAASTPLTLLDEDAVVEIERRVDRDADEEERDEEAGMASTPETLYAGL